MFAFSKTTYVARRAKLMSRVSQGIVFLLGNEEVGINFASNCYPFRQDSTFLYYFGISKPGLCATLDVSSGETVVYGKEQSIDDIVWTGEIPSLRELAGRAGVDIASPFSKLAECLNKAIKSGRRIHFLPPYRPENTLKLQKYLGIHPLMVQQAVSSELIRAIALQRSIKSEEEIEQLHEAVSLSSRMHRRAMQLAVPGRRESEIAAEIHRLAQEQGARLSFPSIVTTQGHILHKTSYENTLKEGDMLLVDAGAELPTGYCGDLSSTVPAGEEFSEKQREIYEIVLASHLEAVKQLKPSVYFMDIYKQTCRKLFEGLKSVGLAKGNASEAVECGAHTLFYQCGLGHMLGLDVHDMEDLGEENVGYTPDYRKRLEFGYKSLRLGKKLETGYVVTVEPGIYFIPQLIDQWKAENRHSEFINYSKVEEYRNFGGIRNEENFVIRPKGCELLGENKPKQIHEIRRMKNEFSMP
ncbi:MAG: Xaa-Pro aminopeptidase [Cytophagales bacterium]|nr:Xaa-Pro aminopeptidase [Cytophagales bacterium]